LGWSPANRRGFFGSGEPDIGQSQYASTLLFPVPTAEGDIRPLSSPSHPNPAVSPEIHLVIHNHNPLSIFIAHCLRSLESPPPVSLLSSRGYVFKDWNHAKGSIVLKTDDVERRQTGCKLQHYDWPVGISKAEFYNRSTPFENDGIPNAAGRELPSQAAANSPAIHSLVVTGPGHLSAKTVRSLRHRLHPHTTVLLLSTGMGAYEEIVTKVYPDSQSRPNFVLGFSTHEVRRLLSGSHSNNTFSIYRSNEPGTIPVFCIPRDSNLLDLSVPSESQLAPSTRYLVDTLTQCPELAISALPFADVHMMMLESLAVDSVIQSVGALLDTSYNGMLYNFTITQVMRLLLTEICLVIRNLPELGGQHDLESRFDPDRLYDVAVQKLFKQFNSTSQMALDARNGKPTEVRYLNGYIVKRGDEIGLRCFMNYLVMQLVRGKSTMVRREVVREIPSDIRQCKSGE
jgi:2-dehydropantoate 2-reductase